MPPIKHSSPKNKYMQIFSVKFWKPLENHWPLFLQWWVISILGILPSIAVQSHSRVWLFATPWTAAHQASLYFTVSLSLLKLMPIELMMLSNHLFPSHFSFYINIKTYGVGLHVSLLLLHIFNLSIPFCQITAEFLNMILHLNFICFFVL